MTTLISETSFGGRRRRCDARCYNAKRPRCRCICSGKNHGAGLAQAGANTQAIAEAILERAKAEGSTVTMAPGLPDFIPAAA